MLSIAETYLNDFFYFYTSFSLTKFHWKKYCASVRNGKINWATLEWKMWARKPGKIIGAAWETRGVSTGGATVKVLLRPTTPPPRGTSRQNSVCVCVWWPAWLRGAQHGPQHGCLIQEGLISGAGGGRTPILGKQATLLFTMQDCIVVYPGLHYAPHSSPKLASNRQKWQNSTRQRNVANMVDENYAWTKHFRTKIVSKYFRTKMLSRLFFILKCFAHIKVVSLEGYIVRQTDRPHIVADSLG